MVGGAQGHVLLPSSRCYAAERGIVVVGGGPDSCAAHEEQRWCVGCVMVRRGVHAAATDIGMLLLRFTSAAIRYRNNAAAVPAYGGTFASSVPGAPTCAHVHVVEGPGRLAPVGVHVCAAGGARVGRSVAV